MCIKNLYVSGTVAGTGIKGASKIGWSLPFKVLTVEQGRYANEQAIA